MTLRQKNSLPRSSAGTRRGRALLLALGGFVLLTALVLLGLPPRAQDREADTGGAGALPVATTLLGPLEGLPEDTSYAGVLRARRSAELAFEVPGRLVELSADEGQAVEAGDIVARVDDERASARLQALDAQLAAARARLAELEAGPRAQTLDASRARVVALRERLALADLQSARRAELAASGAIASEELDVAARGAAALQAELDAAAAQLAELEEGTRAEVLATQAAVVAELEARRVAAALDVDDSALRAPFAGRVQRRLLDEGAFVNAGTPVLELSESTRLEARVGVPVRQLPRLPAGTATRLEVLAPGGARTVAAEVSRVLPEVDPRTRTATLVLRVEATEPDLPPLPPGTVVRLQLDGASRTGTEAPRGHRLPITALTRGIRGLWEVYALVPAEGELFTLERREVELLGTDGAQVLVRGLLSPGDRVVRDGLARVVPGQRVRLPEGDA